MPGEDAHTQAETDGMLSIRSVLGGGVFGPPEQHRPTRLSDFSMTFWQRYFSGGRMRRPREKFSIFEMNLQNRNRPTDLENETMVAGGKKGRGR